MNTKHWIVEMHYMGKIKYFESFMTQAEALEYYSLKQGACRFGLIGWSVTYPREVL